MRKENEYYYDPATMEVDPKTMICKCGQESLIVGVSNWHDGTGMFYVRCACGNKWNVRWKSKTEKK